MAGFLYFVPGLQAHQVDAQTCRTSGLSLALRDVLDDWQPGDNVAVTTVTRGPAREGATSEENTGAGGTIVYPIPIDPKAQLPRTLGFHPTEQEWKRAGDVWIGVDKERRPTPEDLRRPVMIDGYTYLLGDRQPWVCPVVRKPPGNKTNLPSHWGVDSDGEFMTEIEGQFHWAWALSGEMWDVYFRNRANPSNARYFEMAYSVLSLNYRVSAHEVTRLEILGSQNILDVWGAAIDEPTINEWLEGVVTEEGGPVPKKKSSSHRGHSNSSPGDAGTTRPTDQAAPITT